MPKFKGTRTGKPLRDREKGNKKKRAPPWRVLPTTTEFLRKTKTRRADPKTIKAINEKIKRFLLSLPRIEQDAYYLTRDQFYEKHPEIPLDKIAEIRQDIREKVEAFQSKLLSELSSKKDFKKLKKPK